MKWVLVAVLAGCGRFGFEEARIAPPADAAPDVALDAPAASTYYEVSTTGTTATLFTIDIPSGQMTSAGTFTAPSVMGGLGRGPAGTLYATDTTDLYQITLAPFGATLVRSVPGQISDLELDGTDVIGVQDGTNTLARIPPGGGAVTTVPVLDGTTAVMASGGDFVKDSDGTWYWYTNSTKVLYRIDVTTGALTAIGTPGAMTPYVAGLLIDDGGQMYITSASTDQILPIDKTTGLVGAPKTLCVSCPSMYALGPGDSTQTP